MSRANLDYDSTRCILSFELHFPWLKAHYVIISNLHGSLERTGSSWLHDFQVIHYWC